MCTMPELEELRQELKEERDLEDRMDADYEVKMRNDSEYFFERTVETYYFDKPLHLFDVIDKLRQHCFKYDQDFDELLEYMKGV